MVIENSSLTPSNGGVPRNVRLRGRSCRRPAGDTVAYPLRLTSAAPTPHGAYASRSPDDDESQRPDCVVVLERSPPGQARRRSEARPPRTARPRSAARAVGASASSGREAPRPTSWVDGRHTGAAVVGRPRRPPASESEPLALSPGARGCCRPRGRRRRRDRYRRRRRSGRCRHSPRCGRSRGRRR
jgi:hypothetical protein